MKNRNPFSTQSRVRSALQASDRPLRVPEIRELIGLAGEEGYNRVSRAIQDLVKARQAERCGRGFYRFLEDRPDSDYCKKQRVMQRIMWVRTKNGLPFTARKISETSGASLFTAQKYIGWLLEKGVLRKEGKVQVAETAYAPLYLGEDEYLATDDWPIMRTPSRTRQLDGLLNEMRELAQRFFALEDVSGQAISGLKATVSRLGDLVGECEKLKRSLRQTDVEGP